MSHNKIRRSKITRRFRFRSLPKPSQTSQSLFRPCCCDISSAASAFPLAHLPASPSSPDSNITTELAPQGLVPPFANLLRWLDLRRSLEERQHELYALREGWVLLKRPGEMDEGDLSPTMES